MTGGGVNWGSAAFDPVNQILYANTSHAVHIVKLIPSAEAEGFKPPPGGDFGPQLGAPFAMTRAVAMSTLGLLCNKPPWGTLVARRSQGAERFSGSSSVGTSEDRAPLGLAFKWGTPLVNGVVITAGGLVFTGAMDAYLRAFDAKSGDELWQGRLPVPGVANPMTYLWKGEQYVAIAAGGHSEIRHHDRRQRGGVSSGAAGRGALAVVAHHRPAWRTVLEQGGRACAGDWLDGSWAMALAAPGQIAPGRHVRDRMTGGRHAANASSAAGDRNSQQERA